MEYQFNTKISPCLFCAGGHGELVSYHTHDCPLHWHTGNEPVVNLALNQYQAINLLRFLKLAWLNQTPCPNSGDWVGEIPQQLEAKMRKLKWHSFVANDMYDPYTMKKPGE